MQIKTTLRVYSTPRQNSSHQEKSTDKQNSENINEDVCVGGEGQLKFSLWKSVWKFLKIKNRATI